jgi:hypothetical protein
MHTRKQKGKPSFSDLQVTTSRTLNVIDTKFVHDFFLNNNLAKDSRHIQINTAT